MAGGRGPAAPRPPRRVGWMAVAEPGGDLARAAREGGSETDDQVVEGDHGPVHGEVDRSGDVARGAPDRHRDRAQAVGELLVVDGDAGRPHALEVLEQGLAAGARVRAEPAELHAFDRGRALVVGQEREHRLAHRGAVGRQARADVQVEVDLALAPPRAPAALDVDDVRPVEDRHVHRMAGLVAQPLQVGHRDRPQLHRVDRREAEVDHARAEPVLLRRRVLLEVAERGARGDVTMRGAAVQSHLAGELADPEQRLDGGERGEDREPPLQRLRVRTPFRRGRPFSRLHPGVLILGKVY